MRHLSYRTAYHSCTTNPPAVGSEEEVFVMEKRLNPVAGFARDFAFPEGDGGDTLDALLHRREEIAGEIDGLLEKLAGVYRELSELQTVVSREIYRDPAHRIRTMGPSGCLSAALLARRIQTRLVAVCADPATGRSPIGDTKTWEHERTQRHTLAELVRSDNHSLRKPEGAR